MLCTCKYVVYMSKMIQLRNVPETLHRTLKSRAAMEGKSLSDYLIGLIREMAERPTVAELRAQLKKREPVELEISAAEIIRQERDSR